MAQAPAGRQGSDQLIYVKSDDDLAGLRIAIRRPPQDPGDGGLETAAILPLLGQGIGRRAARSSRQPASA